MFCESCGVEAETTKVSIKRNIGLFVLRFPGKKSGHFCKKCINKYQIRYNLISFLFGWWGIFSVFINTYVLLNNLVVFLRSKDISKVSEDAVYPQLNIESIKKINPYSDEIFDRLKNKEELINIAKDISSKTQISPGNIILYTNTLLDLAFKKK